MLLKVRWVFWARMFQGWRNSLARRSWRVRFPSGPQNRWNCHKHINLLYKFRRWCIHTDLSAYESVGDKQKWKPHSGLSWSANRFFLLEWRSAETQNSLEGNPEELGSIPRYATAQSQTDMRLPLRRFQISEVKGSTPWSTGCNKGVNWVGNGAGL